MARNTLRDSIALSPIPDLRYREPVRVVDCTLRDGEQQPGVSFRLEEKLELARMLDQLGVYEIEAGTPAVSKDDLAVVKALADDTSLSARISALARARSDDIKLVADSGAWAVRISQPVSDIQLESKLGISRTECLRRIAETCEEATKYGLAIIFSPFDTTRADPEFLAECLRLLDSMPAVERVRIVDTVGCATPEITRKYISIMRENCAIPIEAHFHNDFGLATINTVTAILEGAEYVSATINGIGERAGNAALEEVVLALELLHGIDTGIELDQLTKISLRTNVLSGAHIQPHKAIVGSNAFRHESGTVVAGALRNPASAEAFPPEMVGQRRTYPLGKLSGMASIKHAVQRLGITLSEDFLVDLLARVKEYAVESKSTVSDETLMQFAHQIRSGSA